jgi:hypothetical protein
MADKAESKSSAPSSGSSGSQKDDRKVGIDLATSPDDFVVEGSDDAQEKGYWGTRPNYFDDEEFALTSGPDSPGERDLAEAQKGN